jgi:hypothetical protein
MFNAKLALCGGSAVIVAAVGLADAASATSPGASTTHPTVRHLVFVDHSGPTKYVDIGKKGFSVGDAFTFSEAVDRHGKKVGVAGGSCTIVAVTKTSSSQQCAITAVLSRGQFTVEGIAKYSGNSSAAVHYAITGGTGAYRTARGQVSITPVSDSSDRIAVDLITG